MQTNEIPEKIIEVLKRKGPSLPIQISKEVGLSSLFISAFLSELSGERKVKISSMKVGGSPLYYLGGQEAQLERFYNYMHPKEAEAFLLLKNKKVLKDSEQKPAIRVALRNIRDFAVGFKKDEEIFWRYAFVPEIEIISILEPKKEIKIEEVKEEIKIEIPEKEIKEIEVKKVSEKPKEIIKPKEERKKQTPEIFLEEIKSYLKQKNIELISLESSNKKEVIAKIRFNLNREKIYLLFAYNKKKITDKELIKAYKKSIQNQSDYMVLFKGELSKKLKDAINAHKNLISADKI